MVSILARLGDRLLDRVVPSITAQAAGTAACTQQFCYCSIWTARYRNCCNGVCGGCNLVLDC